MPPPRDDLTIVAGHNRAHQRGILTRQTPRWQPALAFIKHPKMLHLTARAGWHVNLGLVTK